ncbi:transposable element Tcb2 transposase [Trichonephila clavipes]|nr:transposable element Tcb2 transposase [Trichonephila clavipes]
MEVDPSLFGGVCLQVESENLCSLMDKMVYLEILKNNLQKSAVNVGLGSNFIFQQDNDQTHTAKSVKLYLLYHCKKELHTPPQSSDLNNIENLWAQLAKFVHEHATTSKEDLKNVLKEEWTKISVETTKKLVESMPKRYNRKNQKLISYPDNNPSAIRLVPHEPNIPVTLPPTELQKISGYIRSQVDREKNLCWSKYSQAYGGG